MKTFLKQYKLMKRKLKKYYKNNFDLKNYFPKIASIVIPVFLCVSAITFASTVGTSISTSGLVSNGIIESTSGGIKFPDGTTQTTASSGGSFDGNLAGNLNVTGTLGTEKVTNGGFDTDTAWTKGAGWTISGGAAVKASGAGTLSQAISVLKEHTYEVSITLAQTSSSATYIYIGIGGGYSAAMNASGTYTHTITAINNTASIIIDDFTNGWEGTIDNISVKELTGGTTTLEGEITAKSPLKGKVSILGSFGVSGDSGMPGMVAGGAYGIMGMEEIKGVCVTGGIYCNVGYGENQITSTGSETTATTDYWQTQIASPSGTPSFNQDIIHRVDSVSLRSPATSFTTPELVGHKMSFAESGASTATYNFTNLISIKDAGATKAGSGIVNVSGWRIGFQASDFAPLLSGGTIANNAGVVIEKQTIGTNRYGLILNGDGAGADIALGASQPAKGNINYDGDKLSIGGMALNDFGSRSVCQAWAQIVNPDICFGVFPHATPTTELAMIGTSMTLTYNNVSSTEIVPQGLLWVLNGASGSDEYMSRADSGSSLSYPTGGNSGAVWVYVVDTAEATRGIIAKYGASGSREYRLYIDSTEVLNFTIADSTAGAQGGQYATTSLTAGQWNFVGWSYTGGILKENIVLYANGVALTGAASGVITDFISLRDTGQVFEIGNTGSGVSPYKNKIGHAIMGAGVWTADQHLKMYNASRVMYGL